MCDTVLCSVCNSVPANAGSLQCGHGFCHDCYQRYVDGSVAELRTHLRCCLCGWQNLLVAETRDDRLPLNDFGRNREPRLLVPSGICVRRTGDFVVVDIKLKRVFLFDRRGSALRDFAYLHSEGDALTGVAVSRDDRIIVPLKGRDQTLLCFYTIEGRFLQSAFLPKDCGVSGLVVTSANRIIVADSATGCLLILDEFNRIQESIRITRLRGELQAPCPGGISINSLDNVYVTDAANHCVKVFSSGGQFLFRFGTPGERAGQMQHPAGICVDDADRVIVCDAGNQRVQLFTRHGKFLCFVVRYTSGGDVYVAPVDAARMGAYSVAVLLRGTKDTEVGEARIYEYETTLRQMNHHSELSSSCYGNN